MRSQPRRILCAYCLLACCLLSLTSCGGGTAIQQATVTVQAVPLKIITSQAPNGTVGQMYGFQMQLSGGGPPFNWSVVLGNLPPGVSLNANTGMMAGIPTQEGKFSFTLEVTDSTFSAQQSSMQSLSVAVSAPPLAFVIATLPDGMVGQPYNVQLQATGGTLPFKWSVVIGSPPPGVSLNADTGMMAGIPTQDGEYSFTVEVTDSTLDEQQTSIQSLSLKVSVPPLPVAPPNLQAGVVSALPLAFAAPNLPAGMVGLPYLVQLQASGGTLPYTWSILSGPLAPGLQLNSVTGEISGSPTESGTFWVTFQVTDSTIDGQQASIQSVILTVSVPTLVIATPSLPNGVVGQPYYVKLQAWNGTLPYTWSILSGSLAPGLQLNPLTGEITGTPLQAGTSIVTIQVTDSSSPQNIARLILGGAETGVSASTSN